MTTMPTSSIIDHVAHAQDLGQGAIGAALLLVERARSGNGSWDDVHAALTACSNDLVADDTGALYFGAPAVAFAVHTAAGDTGRYAGTLRSLDIQITALIQRRLNQAHIRINRRQRPHLAEYDLFYGLTGLGTYLLARDPHSETLHRILSYLVRLTQPLPGDDDNLPGWWSPTAPSGHPSVEFPGGHGNAGMAHGIAGPLSLLSLAKRHDATVDGHTPAVERICAWLDTWRQDTDAGPWWPHWVTLAEHRAGTIAQAGPPRPSWCYGTPGLARAQQLAGIALGDTARQRHAEQALLTCLSDPAQLSQIRDASLCHGAAGILHTTGLIARDAEPGMFAEQLPQLRVLLTEQDAAQHDGLLDGTTGPELALLAADSRGATASGWDTCLLAG